MTDPDPDRYHITIEALKHYSAKLTKLLEDERVKANYLLIEDVKKNIAKADEVAKELEEGATRRIAYENERDVICCALINYKKYLEWDKDYLKYQLAQAQPEFPYTDSVIQQLDRCLKTYCDRDRETN